MRLSNLFIVAAVCFLLSPWMFPIDVSSTTFPVNPNGTAEMVGAMRLVFSSPEFGDPNSVSTDYYVLVRVHLSDGVHLTKIGGKTKGQITPSLFIPIALERNYGAPTFPTGDANAVRLIRFDDHYFDLLFTKNMYSYPYWMLSSSDTARVTLGMPAGTVPSDAYNNLGGASGIGAQLNTSFECDFSTSNNDFSSSSFWEVGLSCYHSDSTGTLGSPYNSMFNPSHVALAQSAQFVPLGDLNKDGLVDAVDMAIMANYLTGNMDINLAPPSESDENLFTQSDE